MAVEHCVALDELSRRQHGLVTSEQARAALGPSRKARWIAERRLVSVQSSVLRMAGTPETWHQAVHAAVLATDGVVSHRSAAELWALIRPAGYTEVSVPGDRRPRVRLPAIVHRIKDLRPDLAIEREGMPITDPVRTVVDLGLVLPTWAVGVALGRGLNTRLFTIGQATLLREALGRQGRNGTGVLGEVIERRLLTAAKAESELEARFGELAAQYALPSLEFQHEVWSQGRFVARLDAAIPALMLAIEVDGYEHHASPDAFQRDRTRQNHLVALGWTVLRFTWADVVQRPVDVASTIRVAVNRLQNAA